MFQATTILSVRRKNHVVFAGDGQMSFQNTIIKSTTNKIRKLGNGTILAGFAGNTADAMTLYDMFENKLKMYPILTRAAVELVKEWRSDKMLKNLEALLMIADIKKTLLISGSGDILEPDIDVCAIGSGGAFALASARALSENTDIDIKTIAQKSLSIASDICIYTNNNIVLEEIS